MAAPKGNQYGLALPDPAVRQLAYKSYCDHLALGKSRKSWYYEDKKYSCTWETFETYLKNEDEFPPIKRKISETKGFQKWEQITENAATGSDGGVSNTASLQMVMRNKYGWDKKADEKEAVSNLSDLKNSCEKNEIMQHDGH